MNQESSRVEVSFEGKAMSPLDLGERENAPRGGGHTFGGEGAARDDLRVALEGAQGQPRLHAPDDERVVPAARHCGPRRNYPQEINQCAKRDNVVKYLPQKMRKEYT